MKIAYLGPNGSFTHNAAIQAFPEAELLPLANITEVIKAYEDQKVDFAIVPIENSIEGSVHETTDYLFHQAEIQAVAEIIQPIKQQLMAVRTDRNIEKIFSHPQAIAQGKKYIKHHYPNAKIEMTASTAYAARLVAEHPQENFAAIAPKAAADEYGLSIIAQDIQEIEENYTRFWVLGHQVPEIHLEKTDDKVSLALTLPDNLPGALYKALSTFAWRGIDLTKIESRPLKTVLGEYFFIIDFENDNKKLVSFALEELTSIGIQYKILGMYAVYRL
ncbi:prephenate dehydratase [Streptococcus ratti]|uniref:Prephenate dehydratase n=1 Tax=Streptococcus ratti FA-1 = DSM 20564 TaxID=699248 RepID=A0ABN0GTC5_STRRT|nr:prephenate dehydratase [Streptococcus ratti]EJN93641.1 prephenate dehydratase [Streptococcus ratti FA-1 = DSM 20564]EMP71270.1 prephenate dehydratase [Streptococcus ratti FA-1 = DSM 20564]QEY07507.1 prephenate dehydratase [Streptococcus ratti]VEI59956.1 prephenate dehydratase [Streptococcus mutans]